MKKRHSSLKNSLYSKLVVTYFIVILISFVFLAVFLSVWFERYYYAERKEKLISQQPIFNNMMEGYKYGTITPKTMDSQLEFLDSYLNTRIWIVDRYMFVIASSSKEDKELFMITTDEMYDVLKGNIVSKEGAFKDKFKTPMLTVAYPIIINNQVAGAVIMNSPVYEIKNTLNNIYRFIWVSAVLAIVASTVIIYFLSQRIIIKPLYEINETARLISSGEFERRVSIASKDEIGDLANSFNTMADSLQKLEDLRREFIANVSHELRSPITSIKGYIQGIIDGTIPEEKHEYCLNIALDESRRLTRLINDLLDLSKLESGEFSLSMGQFDINELIRISIIRFENEIEKKKINVDVMLAGDSLYVLGDRDRIGQVLSNLIDNAIKFTGENGKIGLKTTIDDKNVIVGISDTGIGIKEEELIEGVKQGGATAMLANAEESDMSLFI